jgi:thiol-disulfide isomerase/thioredoxin
MKSKILFLYSLCFASLSAKAQQDTSITHNIGDTAPPLLVKEWIKGAPIDSFEKGKVYVVDFWATWCAPCIAAMPHLSTLAHQYEGKATFAAIDVKESFANFSKNDTEIKAFVDRMGSKMDFNVALADTSSTVRNWLDAYQIRSIPTTYVIDGHGRVAWIGHPYGLDTVLQKVIDDTWDIKIELAQLKYNDYLDKLDTTLASRVRGFSRWSQNLGYLGSPDSTLKVINQMVGIDKNLKYMPWTTYYTFSALLKTDTCKAYEFGEQALTLSLSPFEISARESLINAIRDDMSKFSTPKQIMAFGAECLQREIIDYNNNHYLRFCDLAEQYKELAEWYRKGGEKAKALEAEKKAVKLWEKELQMDEHP